MSLLITVTGVFGQTLSIRQYSNEEDNLPSNSVYSITIDKKGYLWAATEYGFGRYDGIQFKNYAIDNGLVSSHCLALFEDINSDIWIGTTKGLSRFNGKNFRNYGKDDGLKDDYIQSVAGDSLGNIWVATRYAGVAYLDSANRFVHLGKKDGMPSDSIETRCVVDNQNVLWIATTGYGVFSYKNGELKNYTEADGLCSDTLYSVDKDKEGNIWFGSVKKVSRFDGEKFETINLDFGMQTRRKINFVFRDKDKNLWIGTEGSGLLFYDGEEFKRYSKQNGFTTDKFTSCIEDARGDLWFGTRTGGLVKVPVEKFLIYSEQSGLKDNVAYAIFKDNSNTLWISSEGSGITKINETTGKIEYLNTETGFPSNDVPGVIGDSKGNVWISTIGVGVTKYDGKTFTNYTVEDGLPNPFVMSMLEDSEGNIWFGHSGAISMYDINLKKIVYRESTSDITGEGWVQTIFEDFEGFLWFGTEDRGMLKFNKHRFIKGYTVKDGLPDNFILYITQDKFGNIWSATESGGISKFDGESFTNYSEKDGLPSNLCYSIIEHTNYLYIGTGKGLSRFEYMAFNEKGKDAFKTYTQKDGIADNETNQFSIYKDKKFNIYFGSQGGVTRFNPKDKPREAPSNIYINNVQITNEEAEIDTIPTGKLKLGYSSNNLRFEYVGIDFISPEKVLYRYKLEGSEMKWTESYEHSVSYRGLPAGEYTFKVMCRNSDGLWSEGEAAVPFVIFPPFWQTWWFYTIVIFIGLAGITMFYQYKTRQVKRRNLELAQTVKRRTRELEEEKDKSEALLLNILPSICVDELKDQGKVEPREFKNVSILFTDFKSFTYTASVLPADKLVNELNDIFKGFDEIVERYNLEKMKTIGDSYMAAGGIPIENKDHAIVTVRAALDMQQLIEDRNAISAIKWEMRAGIHSGSVISGVVGTKKFVYDIWGDTVNIASRMESSGEPGKVNISAYTYMLVKDYFDCEYRGKLDAKGKGKVDMYFVHGIKEKDFSATSQYHAGESNKVEMIQRSSK